MRLLLTLLALLTGLASADRAVAAPAMPAAMGSLVLLAESATKAEANDSVRRPATNARAPRNTTNCTKPRKAAPPHLPGLLTGSDRALE
ncbi:hypothetical protein [Sphingopyxis kveilinensis]|uniref:hypothetical protein n=1 Tax=Sphingopyxis kveilinensis TaxID=3114367 RepID=UPI0030CB8012